MTGALHGLFALACAAEEAGLKPSVPEVVMEHVTDGKLLEFRLPFVGGVEFQLPVWTVHLGNHTVDLGPTKHVFWMWFASLLLFLFAWLATRLRGHDLVPKGAGNVVEMLVLFVRDEIALKTMDPHTAEAALPYLLTAFFFILFSAGVGLFPYTATSVGNLSVTAAMALMTFTLIQVTGVRQQGLFGYIGHIVPAGVPWALYPLMFVVEVLGMFTKTFALCIRLFANMIAGHFVILFVLGLVFLVGSPLVGIAAVPFAVFLYLLEMLIILIQAYIFTLLSALFIGMAAHAH
ncbi:MAG: F0F1 ATP synthase subunit A [Deltaproteobacteria bacterium]